MKMISKTLKEKINECATLRPNWDGDGALPFLKETVDNSIKFLETLDAKYLDKLDSESIYPNPHATITFEWEEGKDLINIEIGKTSFSCYAQIKNQDYGFDNGKFPLSEIPKEVINKFEMIYPN